MTSTKTIIVTGANRGIGKAICSLLLADTSLGPIRLFATSRSGKPLDFPLRDPDTQEVVYPELDVSEPDSIKAFAGEVRRKTQADGTAVDVLINNAGVYLGDSTGDGAFAAAKRTLAINYQGTRMMCEQFIPQISPTNGRIVNISSIASSLQQYDPAIRSRFRNPDITFAELDALVEEYLTDVRNRSSGSIHSTSPFGPSNRAYNFSKASVNVMTSILARQHKNLSINCCCPGWVATDMGIRVGRSPPKTPEQGATIPLRLALGDLGGVSGKYWANESVRGKGTGQVMEWGEDGAFVPA